ncbi:hypothetical protein B0H16DRAFT_1741736 [Mycena metata]|uniref:Uncharacterized protein n=1 Tax=Mycena metata TaxID=1033252 RepID=A0AAD7HA30_9AGAR|nr:hypothetical protein B0H16DRAFT_1741736 [Mycena metata]
MSSGASPVDQQSGPPLSKAIPFMDILSRRNGATPPNPLTFGTTSSIDADKTVLPAHLQRGLSKVDAAGLLSVQDSLKANNGGLSSGAPALPSDQKLEAYIPIGPFGQSTLGPLALFQSVIAGALPTFKFAGSYTVERDLQYQSHLRVTLQCAKDAKNLLVDWDLGERLAGMREVDADGYLVGGKSSVLQAGPPHSQGGGRSHSQSAGRRGGRHSGSSRGHR